MLNEFQPYVGPRPFGREDRGLFFGRDREIRDLRSLVTAHQAALFYAQSGAGKTSLLNVGLIPVLEEEGFEVLPIVLMRGLIPEDIQIEQIPNPYTFNALISWAEDKPDSRRLARMSLADFLKGREHPIDEEGMPLFRIAIFDQFEEFFALYPEHWGKREDFFRQMSEALEEDPLLRVLFAIREDHLANLDPYDRLLPEELRTRYRLERLRAEAACRAVEEPLGKTNRSFAEGVAARLVRQLLDIQVQSASGETVEVAGEYVELVQLQVVCQKLWNSIPSDVTVITSQHLQTFGSVEEALRGFYETAIETVMKETNAKEGELRKWFENQLITPAGTRGTVFHGQEYTGGIPDKVVHSLENQHIIRAEMRAGARWYELTHDRLIEPIRNSNEVWNECQRAEEQQRELEAERRRTEEQQLRAEEQARIARRLRRLTLAMVMAFLIAACAGVFAFLQWRYAREQADDAEKRWIQAEKAKRATSIAREDAAEHARLAGKARDKEEAQRKIAEEHARTAEERRKEAVKAKERAKAEEENAKVEKQKAEAEAQRAKSRELAMSAVNSLDTDPELGILLALQAVSESRSDDGTVLPELKDTLENTLHQALQASRVRLTFHNHTAPVAGVAFSPDGACIVTGDSHGFAKVWEATSGSELLTIYCHSDAVNGVAFSPNGLLFATASDDGTVKVWDSAKGYELLTLYGHIDTVNSVAFSPDGMLLATASDDGTAKVWDVINSGDEPLTLSGHAGEVMDIAFSPDGRYLATASYDETAKVWDGSSGYELFTFYDHTDAVNAVAFSPDGTRIATADMRGIVRVWDVASGRVLTSIIAHSNWVLDLAFSPGGAWIATSSYDGTAKVWDASSGHELFSLRSRSAGTAFPSVVTSVTFSPDAARIATANWDKTVRVWTTISGEEIPALYGHIRGVNSVVFSPDGKHLATASDDGMAKLWDVVSGQEVLTLSGHTDVVKDIAFSPDGRYLATASYDETAKLWDAVSGQELRTFSGHKDELRSVAFSPDGRSLATASQDGTAKVWDVVSGQEKFTLSGHTDGLRSVAFSPDGRSLATASQDGTAKVWDVVSGQEKFALSGHIITLTGVVFSPDGSCIATASKDKTVRLWDAVSGEEKRTFSGHNDTVIEVAFSPDGARIATTSIDGTAKVWDVVSGREIHTFSGYSGDVNSVAFSLDGKRLATAGSDGMVHIYALDIEDLVELGKKRVTRPFTVAECLELLDQEERPQTAMVLMEEGRQLARETELDEAVVRFQKAQELDPRLAFDPETEAKRQLAAVLLRFERETLEAGDIDTAHKSLVAAQQMDPAMRINPDVEMLRSGANILVNQGRELAREGNVDDAARKFRGAMELNPTLKLRPEADARRLASQAFVEEGWTLISKGELEEAIGFLENAVSLDPDHDLAHRVLGILYREKGEYDKAMQHFHKAIEIAPRPEHYVELADTHRQTGDYDQAIGFVNKALRVNPEYSTGYLVLGIIEFEGGKYKDAISAFKKVKESDDNYESAISVSGAIYFDELFEYEAAYEKYRWLAELKPEDVSYAMNFAEANLATERFKEAYRMAQGILAEYGDLQSLNPSRQLAMRLFMLSSLILQEDIDEADEALEEFINYYKSVVDVYEPEWHYKGTRNFIAQRKMNENRKNLLLRLIDILETPTPDVKIEKFRIEN